MFRFCLILLLSVQMVLGAVASNDLYQPPYSRALKDIYLINVPGYGGAAFYLVVNVGEADMNGPAGLSHYLEHLALFSALEKERGELSIKVEENAFAYKLATVFYGYAESSADYGAVMRRLGNIFQPIELDRQFMREERRIVEREFEQGVQAEPLSLESAALIEKLFDGQSVGRSVIGTSASIRELDIDKALAVHDEFYRPDNASLYVLGEINYSKIAKHVKDVFSITSEKGDPHQRKALVIGDKRHLDEVERPDLYRDRLIFKKAISFPEQYDWAQKLVLLDHLDEILLSSRSGGVRKALQLDAFWAADLEIDLDFITENVLLLEISAAPDFDVTLEDLALEIERQLSHLADSGVSRMRFYDLKNDTEFFYNYLQNSPTDLHEYTFKSLLLNVAPIQGEEIAAAAKRLTHLDYDAVMQAIAAPSDTAILYLRATQ
ncbi:hypothetical protein MXMO3_02888 [Maritalea myrionectae]|uniref:Peptidase M16 N-terminal domain-containing protein n=1 Tax=Maritalea myrionectae TaxID=454601 RepID=A0A2R4MH87_9HYPH|nr:insulinase family protein [Maritalea myrionectae]AVX05398.1 hypothetical protein MXMO3_02888 [Maritalea myrionectae]